MIRIILIITAVLHISCSATGSGEELFIRVNQVGYFPEKIKNAMIISKKDLQSKEFFVINAANSRRIMSGSIGENVGSWGDFKYNYRLDFTSIAEPGKYYIESGGKRSPQFRIANDIYSTVADSLIRFFQAQRCGATNPLLHQNCHIWDSPKVVGDNSVTGIDVTGGWHDAGDYIKFLNTSAFSTYMLLLSYQLNRPNSDFDNNKNNTPDILEEARVGLDWIIRCNYSGTKLISQVQDMRDHTVGWRLPENDSLRYDRPAYLGGGKNLIGITAASLALASRIWRERFHEDEFANHLLSIAQKLYAAHKSAPDVDQTNSGMYTDRNYLGKLALGAIELYAATQNPIYLSDAKQYAAKAGSDYWWSWGDVNSLAQFRIASYDRTFADYIINNVVNFNNQKNINLYYEGAAYTWGTTHTMLGVALQALFLKRLNQTDQYDSLIIKQLDYIFGMNPWGVSFIYGFGAQHVKNLHSQIAYFHKGYLPGAISAGPAPVSILSNYQILRENSFAPFNSNDVQFFDDRQDYITNEPTIITNATAMCVFLESYLRKK